MGASKIVFVGAVAVIIGLFGVGIKKGEQRSADIAALHAYQLQAKTLAEQALQIAARKLPSSAATTPLPTPSAGSTSEGSYSYSVVRWLAINTKQVRITAIGTASTQRITMYSTLEELPAGPKPSGVKTWNRWKQVSPSWRVLTTITP